MAPEQPGVLFNSPGTAPEQPGVLFNSPGTAPEQPGVLFNSPGTAPEQPGVLFNSPGTAPEQPGAAVGRDKVGRGHCSSLAAPECQLQSSLEQLWVGIKWEEVTAHPWHCSSLELLIPGSSRRVALLILALLTLALLIPGSSRRVALLIPGTADPGIADPGTAHPWQLQEGGTADPGTADPGTADPGTADPWHCWKLWPGAGVPCRVQLEAEGSFQCSVTGLIFEVAGAARVTYSLLSWSKFAALVQQPWIVGGPLFDVRCSVPTALRCIHFPHCLCLRDGDGAGVAFKVLHIKGGGAAMEPSAEFSASHVKWVVSSLSPVGPLIHSHQPLQYHGAVILYKAIDEHPSLSFWVYLATNNDSFIKDISKAVKHSKRKFVQIEKPPVCQKLLQEGKKYRLICEPEAEITPEEIEFVDGSLLKLKSYFEVYLEKPDDFTLSLVEQDSDETVWKARLRERDWIHYDQNKNEQKRSTGSVKKRKPALNILEEEGLCSKKQKTGNTADGMGAKSLTDQQLLVIAKLLDRSWREMAIECLQIEMKDIDDVRAMEEDVTMQKLLVLRKWREREQGHGTAEALQRSLGDKATYEILQALQGFLAQS